MADKKALLINTNTNGGNRWLPLQFTSIATDNTTIADINLGHDIVGEIKKGYDIVGLSVLSSSRWDAFDTARLVRKLSPKSVIVMGGAHATAMPDNCKKHCDIVVVGDGESAFRDVCEGRDPVSTPTNLNNVWQRYDLVDPRLYRRVAIQATRGCRYKCRFCSSWWTQGEYRMREPSKVAWEIKKVLMVYSLRDFYFNDDSFYLDKEKAIEFCGLIDGLRIRFHIETRADIIDKEYAEALKRAGCSKVQVGLESGSPEIRTGKSVDSTYNGIRACKDAGLKVDANLIVGNEGETDETIEETRRFLKLADPDSISTTRHGLLLFPGTAIYQRAKRDGDIDDEFWESRTPFKTYKYSQEQIDRWNRRIYSFKPKIYLRYLYDKWRAR